MKAIPGSAVFAAIDLKSFYASVECAARHLDPLTALLVVADESRTEKTICLAVSPAMKAYGLPGRCRLFEVMEKAREVEARTGKKLDYIIAPPRMRLYIETSKRIYDLYLEFFAPEDIHVYSIDEVMIDLTKYLALYKCSPRELVRRVIQRILRETGITATGGIGTNLYLAKVAMDILAKHVDADEDGVRIAEVDERTYRETLWPHRPITDFWRTGRGIAKRLERYGIYTMGDLARMSLISADTLYREFGVDAELMIDHAWGLETCTMADIKAFEPETRSISQGQVLAEAYSFEKARVIVQEMADQMSLELVEKRLTAAFVSLTVVYDKTPADYQGEMIENRYAGRIPKPAHGVQRLEDVMGNPAPTASARRLMAAALSVYDRTVSRRLPVRRIYLDFGLSGDQDSQAPAQAEQLSLFAAPEITEADREAEEKERRVQEAMLQIKSRYGKNAILKGMNLQKGATAMERNRQVGGHQAELKPEEQLKQKE